MPCIDAGYAQVRAFVDRRIVKIFLLTDRLLELFHEDDHSVAGQQRFVRFHFPAARFCLLHIDAASAKDLPNGVLCQFDSVPQREIQLQAFLSEPGLLPQTFQPLDDMFRCGAGIAVRLPGAVLQTIRRTLIGIISFPPLVECLSADAEPFADERHLLHLLVFGKPSHPFFGRREDFFGRYGLIGAH